MYLFSITINIEDGVREEWLSWINTKVKVLLSDKSKVHDFRVLKILNEEPGHGSTYSFQYHLPNLEGVDLFEEFYDQEVAADMYRFYKEKFVEFRTRLEVIDWNL
jgi:hypothetical protein